MLDLMPVMIILGLNRALKVIEEDVGAVIEDFVTGSVGEQDTSHSMKRTTFATLAPLVRGWLHTRVQFYVRYGCKSHMKSHTKSLV
jgi:hypothetical protein